MPERMNDTQINAAVRMAVTGAVDFIDSEIAEDRIKAQRYFNGEVDLGTEEGRSAVVATKVRDTIRMVKPVLMRTFLQADKPVEFVPRGQDDVAAAEQATDYVSWKFNECDGYSILTDVFHDALIKKTGIAKAWWDETEEVEFDEYSNLTPEAMQLVLQDPNAEILEQVPTAEGLFDVKVAITKTTGRMRVKSIAPEDFFVDASADSLEDSVICGDRAEMRVGDLVEMGFDFDEVSVLAGTDDTGTDEEADFERQGYSDEWDTTVNDPSMRKIVVTEAYMRMDIEGTGIPRLYQFICAGTNHEVLDYSPADERPYAVFEIDPEPHTFFGRSLADILIHDQTAATSLLRGLIDNVHMTNNPRLVVDTQYGDLDDAMNGEIGAILRAKGNAQGAYFPLTVPFTAQATLPALQYYDQEIESKTGVARSSLGMDADALQSTTAAGVNAAVQAASAAVELMARNLAEGGMRQLFRLMLRLSRQHANPNDIMRINGQFVPVNPQSWSASMDLTTNVGLGTGQHEVRVAALRETLAHQMQIWSNYGPTNGMVSMTGIRNTIEDILRLSGVHNADRYWNPMNPQTEQQLLMQAAQAAKAQQGQGSDPNAAFMQVEQMKAQSRMQTDMAKLSAEQQKAAAEFQLEARKLMMEDDRERDAMEQEAVLKAAELLGKHGVQVDANRIRELQAQQRPGMAQGQ